MEHLDSTPLSSTQIKSWTDTDLILSKVRKWVQKGWPDRQDDTETNEDLSPYSRRRLELGVIYTASTVSNNSTKRNFPHSLSPLSCT